MEWEEEESLKEKSWWRRLLVQMFSQVYSHTSLFLIIHGGEVMGNWPTKLHLTALLRHYIYMVDEGCIYSMWFGGLVVWWLGG